jgi:Rps23 Pro-64 3,4-dihydroxylase Tpa1-like proline 4-hydroxylase
MVDFVDTDFYSRPFEYFTGNLVIDQEFSIQILEWFETKAPWELVETEFYDQFEFDFLKEQVPEYLSFLVSKAALQKLRVSMEKLFDARLNQQIDITAHRLVAGQRIRIHNDFVPNQETHRILIQLNRGWNAKNGGLLMLFNSADPVDVHKVLLPEHKSVLGFAISPDSNHAVSTIHEGERFTLVYSFYRK